MTTQDKTAARRFGRHHAEPCSDPTVLTCARWECQNAGRCRETPEAMRLEVRERWLTQLGAALKGTARDDGSSKMEFRNQ